MLVVEDDENDEILLRRAFDECGHDIPLQFVRDGQQAIDYLNGDGPYADRAHYPLPTLILLDLKMPRLSGFDVLRWLRAQPVFAGLPVIVLSGSMWPGDIDEAYRLGANSYLIKPAKRQELIEIAQMASTYWFCMNLGSRHAGSTAAVNGSPPASVESRSSSVKQNTTTTCFITGRTIVTNSDGAVNNW